MGLLSFAETAKRVKRILIGNSFDKKINYSFMSIQENSMCDLIKKYKQPFSNENKPILY